MGFEKPKNLTALVTDLDSANDQAGVDDNVKTPGTTNVDADGTPRNINASVSLDRDQSELHLDASEGILFKTLESYVLKEPLMKS